MKAKAASHIIAVFPIGIKATAEFQITEVKGNRSNEGRTNASLGVMGVMEAIGRKWGGAEQPRAVTNDSNMVPQHADVEPSSEITRSLSSKHV